MATRAALRREAVPAGSPTVPPRIDALLAQLKNALTDTAAAAFRCAPAAASTEQLQTTLATALHANLTAATETPFETRGNQDVGAFGSDLAVQVLQLFGKPRLFEVDFRYGVECGDDNLLLIFEAPDDASDSRWHERLRWDAPRYNTVGDAFGDFVLLTPLTGNYQHPTWRYLVAHGQPGCGETPRPSRFLLDLLNPTADPARPSVDWHLSGAYSEGNTVPRLATTEDTIDFRLLPAPQAATSPNPKPTPSGALPAPPAPAERIYRFHLDSAGNLVPDLAPSPGPATH